MKLVFILMLTAVGLSGCWSQNSDTFLTHECAKLCVQDARHELVQSRFDYNSALCECRYKLLVDPK